MDAPRRIYRIAPELRRCCWYVVVGAGVLAGLAWWLDRVVLNRPAADAAAHCLGLACLAAVMALPLSWRLRIDEHGVARRLFWQWNAWSWDDLASGRIVKRHPVTLYDPARPWHHRRLRLSSLSSADLREAMAIINERYRLPPPPAVPDQLTIKYGFRRTLTLDAKGVHVVAKDAVREHLWSDVREIHVVRMDSLRRDFRRLVITLPDEEITLQLVSHQGGTTPSWRGADADVINEALVRYVAPERISVTLAGELPQTRSHVERRLAEARKTARELNVCLACFVAPLIAGFLVWMAIDDGIIRALAMAAMMAVWPGSLLVYLVRMRRRQIAELEALLQCPSLGA